MQTHAHTGVYMQPAGTSGRLWDVWTSPEATEALDGWLGFVELNTAGYVSQDPGRRPHGPFPSPEEAAEALNDQSG